MRSTLCHIADAAGKFFFPNRCLACGNLYRSGPDQVPNPEMRNLFPTNFSALMTDYLCSDCRTGYEPVRSPICPMCGLEFDTREGEDHLCQNCSMRPKHFHQARACGHYSGPLMKAIHRMKYGGDIQLTRPLGMLLYSTFIGYFQTENIDMVLPVPLHRSKFRQRGFNQSFMLIRDWNRTTRNEDSRSPNFRVVRDALIRTRPTAPQTELGRAERLFNIRNAFQVVDPQRIKGRHILLVDDVYTTGATVNECAGVLSKSHAGRIDVLTLARAMN